MDWKLKFLEGLRYRNMVESANMERVFVNYHALYDDYTKLKEEYDEKQRDFRKRVNTSVTERGSSSEMTEDYVRRISELQDQVHGLNEELRLSYRNNVKRSEDIIKTKEDLKQSEEKNTKFEKDLEKEKIDNNILKSEIDDLNKTVESKDSTIKILISEKEVLDKKFGEQKEKYDKLNLDYDKLIQQVLQNKQKIIDRINENNELQMKLSKKIDELDKLKKKYRTQSRRGSRGGGGGGRKIKSRDRQAADEYEDRLLLTPPEGADQKVRLDTVGNTVTFSPSGNFFAAGCDDHTIKLFALSSRKVVHSFRCGNEPVIRVCISAHDELILGTSTDSSIRVFNMRDKRLKHTMTGHSKKVFAAGFSSRDVKRIATGSHDRTIKLWDMYRGTLVKTILAQSSVNDLEISSSNLVFSGHFDRTVKIFDIRTYKKISEFKNIHEQQITSVNVSSNERHILTCGRDSMLKVHDFRTRKMICMVNNDQFRNSVNYSKAVFSPCGTYAAGGSHNGKLVVWNVDKGLTQKVYKKGHNGPIQGVDWNSLGDKIVTCGTDKSIVLWN